MKINTTIEFGDYIITYENDSWKAEFLNKSINKKITVKYRHLDNGELFFNFKEFNNGFFFLDNKGNFFDTEHGCYYRKDKFFEGESNKIPYIMFDDNKDELIKQKIKEGINKMNKELDGYKKYRIENEIENFLANELKNFDIKNFKFKNGKINLSDNFDYYIYKIHDNIMEIIKINKNEKKEELVYIGDFIQDNENINVNNFFLRHGRGRSNKYPGDYVHPNTESEVFYGNLLGRGIVIGDKKSKFFCDIEFIEDEQNDNENITFYIPGLFCRNKIFAEVYNNNNNNNKRNNLGRILVKDLDGKTIIYEINVNMKIIEEYSIGQYAKPEGMGIVKDYRNGDILIVNFDTNNIITDNINDLTLFLDKEEFDMNKENYNEEKKEPKLDPTKEISNNNKDNNMNAKEIINNMINYGTENNINLEKLANKVNEKIIIEKLKHFGIKNQGYTGECWVYSLAEIIYMANARKYGRKLENFQTIYDSITKKYGRRGKTDEEREKIMNEILKKDYDLDFKKIIDENRIKEFIKRGIKCLCSFSLSKREWENFCDYFEDKSKDKEKKVLTKEILDKPNIKDPDKIGRHAVVLIDIDKDDNYILLNSWGEKWGNKGIFKAKKECLKESVYYAVYFYPSLLKEEEIEVWNKLKNIIKNSLKEIKSIRCPKCKGKARIEKFNVIDRNILKCPFEDACIFEIKNEDNNYDIFNFLAELLLDNKKKLFDFGFID